MRVAVKPRPMLMALQGMVGSWAPVVGISEAARSCSVMLNRASPHRPRDAASSRNESMKTDVSMTPPMMPRSMRVRSLESLAVMVSRWMESFIPRVTTTSVASEGAETQVSSVTHPPS